MTGNRTDTTLPLAWVWTTLDRIVEILDRQRVPINSKERAKRIEGKPTDHLYPYYGATGQVGWIDDYLFDEELVLLGEDGAPFLDFGKDVAYLIRGKSWVNNHAHVLRAQLDKLNNRFLLHYLNVFDFHGYVTGTTRLKLNQGVMRDIPIALAPLAEQRRIVEVIEALFTQLDAGVAALKRAQRQVQRYKASVLKAACEGRLVPQNPNDEPADDLLRRILAERRVAWKGKGKYQEPAGPDTEGLPELPVGWVWASMEQLSPRVTVGYVGKMKDQYIDTGIPFLRSQNVRENRFSPEGLQFISPEFHDEIAKSTLHPGDLVVVRSGSVGVTCVIPAYLEEANCSDLVIIQKSEALISEYGAYYMNSLAKRYVRAGQVGVALIHFNTKSVAELHIPLPPLAEQQRIVEEVERRFSVVAALEKSITANLKRAERLRHSILKRAFAGHLVPQDPQDEPASALLARIRAERARGEGKQPGLDV